MTAAESIARWREAEEVATAPPWQAEVPGSATTTIVSVLTASDEMFDPTIAEAVCGGDATFIASSREAMPALLEFAEAMLALATTDKTVCLCVKQSQIRDLAEQHLGGTS